MKVQTIEVKEKVGKQQGKKRRVLKEIKNASIPRLNRYWILLKKHTLIETILNNNNG